MVTVAGSASGTRNGARTRDPPPKLLQEPGKACGFTISISKTGRKFELCSFLKRH